MEKRQPKHPAPADAASAPRVPPSGPRVPGGPPAPDRSTSAPGLKRTHLEMPVKRNLMVAGTVLFAFATLAALTLSYQSIFFAYMIYIIFILMVYVVLWYDGGEGRDEVIVPARWPSVSVVIPSYNARHTLLHCIESVKALRYPHPLQIVVVDDGSQDGSREALAQVPGITLVLKEKNAGKAAALNTGLAHATGEIIACVDSDTYPRPDVLERCVGQFEKDPTLGAVTMFITTTPPANLLQAMQEIEYWVSFGFYFKTLETIDGLYVTPGPMALYRRAVFDTLGGYDEHNLGEDMEIALRMQRAGYGIKLVSSAIVHTDVPATLRSFFRQRVRWVRSAIMNVLEYTDLFLNPKHDYFGLFVLPFVLLNGLFTSLFTFWTLLHLAEWALNLATPWMSNFYAMVPSLAAPAFDPYLFDSVGVLGLLSLLIFGYFVSIGMRLAGRRFGREHVLPLLVFLAGFPFFLGLTVLYAYAMEFMGRKYKW